MLVQQAMVVEAGDGVLQLKPVDEGCHSCSSSQCGVASLSKLFGNQERLLTVNDPGGFEREEVVELLLDEKVYMLSVFFQYLWPLVVMFTVLLITVSVTAVFFLHLIMAILSLLIGFRSASPILQWLGLQLGRDRFYIRKLGNAGYTPSQSIEVISQ